MLQQFPAFIPAGYAAIARQCLLVSLVSVALISLHCLLPTPTRLIARNLMLSTGMVQLCPTVAHSPHQLSTSPLDYSV